MTTAQNCLSVLLDKAMNHPVDTHLGAQTRKAFKARNKGLKDWRGLAASPFAFSAIVEAACEMVESPINNAARTSQAIMEAEKSGRFAFNVSVHSLGVKDRNDLRGQDTELEEKNIRPMCIIVERLDFLREFEVYRLV